MKLEDLPPQFDDLLPDTRKILAAFGDQGFEDAAALVDLVAAPGSPSPP